MKHENLRFNGEAIAYEGQEYVGCAFTDCTFPSAPPLVKDERGKLVAVPIEVTFDACRFEGGAPSRMDQRINFRNGCLILDATPA